MRRPALLTAAAIGGLALGLTGCSAPSSPISSPTPTGTATPPAKVSADPVPLPLGTSLPAGSRVTVVGDSIVRGLNVETEQAWPALVGDNFGWDVTDLGCDGGGFIEPGDCGQAIGDRAEEIADTQPDAIVLIASSNDLGWAPEEVDAAIVSAVDAIAAASPSARLIAIDSVWGPDPRPTDLDQYDVSLIDAVTAADGGALEYPDPLSEDGLLGDDGVHPTVEGHRALAHAFEVAAEKSGLARPVPTDQRATDAPAD
ncbi:SGNH/GDSL hydrolase family protein [Rathayibacter tritici]|uniref:SGNH hydrolase-type esterase domain-containing protein n=1 Tax=Rathayibacter tritici TaxID=33888 RepID=A0A169BZM0_9MICO|nr:SGNH/GDSL hydrolase family protein [Rathayibacter tritici]AND16635.1 hypothetical protein A6122_1498 [Rathayibacter tritici]PPF28309.1 SGNH/GDSL hydrolase family protein [Rathayibacter tritici]PPF65978.1 SGNH/GDSL hydrolase family protein [Rathayibacter tritici]PPG09440.1 SGNH/GDSL hydrolase family protein [Rathayibacter tritici]PPI13263.1 SGNH/GDSL hydrolase family protein [Rathayibacter tritici]